VVFHVHSSSDFENIEGCNIVRFELSTTVTNKKNPLVCEEMCFCRLTHIYQCIRRHVPEESSFIKGVLSTNRQTDNLNQNIEYKIFPHSSFLDKEVKFAPSAKRIKSLT